MNDEYEDDNHLTEEEVRALVLMTPEQREKLRERARTDPAVAEARRKTLEEHPEYRKQES